jgi:glycolate oxidase iron-sulfur subunit
MQTSLAPVIKDTPQGREADAILRSCVHCGFCNATCPTYQLLSDELDGPRGRIYLIKQVLEGQPVSAKTQLHLDRCLTCQACETTCPSGVQYHRLVDIGRQLVTERVPRPLTQRLLHWGLRAVLPYRHRFTPLLRLAQGARPVLPATLRQHIPRRQPVTPWPAARHHRRMLVLDGCVQPGIAPNINAAAARVLDRLGISLIRTPGTGCCGALSYHLDAREEGLQHMRCLIDAWWPQVEAGIEAIVMTASGCGNMVKEYGVLLQEDSRYREKAARIAALTHDIGEILDGQDLSALPSHAGRRIACHLPCSLQHGQRLGGVVEGVLRRLGFILTPVADAHLCCGASGTYAILQPALATPLRNNKLTTLEADQPELIVTANIGCLTHLQAGSRLPVRHWIEVVEDGVTIPFNRSEHRREGLEIR